MFILSLRSQECCPSQAGENFTGRFSQEKGRIGLTCSSALSRYAGTFNIIPWWRTATCNSSPFEWGVLIYNTVHILCIVNKSFRCTAQ